MKKPKKLKLKKKYKLDLTFTRKQMEKVREEVAQRMDAGLLRRKTSIVDEMCYTIAWTFHQALSGRKVKNGVCR
jgi:hypothetical protein